MACCDAESLYKVEANMLLLTFSGQALLARGSSPPPCSMSHGGPRVEPLVPTAVPAGSLVCLGGQSCSGRAA